MGQEFSRRNFLKGGFALGLGAATAAAFGSLSGCSPKTEGAKANSVALTPSGISYSLHSADVIVVGGGMAGLNATQQASDAGASVILVDKGPVGHSGNSGVLWGQTYVTAESTTDDGVSGAQFLAIDVMGILDQDQAREVSRAQIEAQPRRVIEGAGNMFQRGDDGQVLGLGQPTVTVTHNTLYKQQAQLLVKRGIPVFDNTMMLDIMLDDEGNASGIIAINLDDGSAHVFRGKKVILCTGGYHWVSRSAGSPESTGEGHLALLKRGYAFKDMEFPQYDFSGIRPFGYRPDKEKDQVEIGVELIANGEIHHRMYNKDKQQFTKAFFSDPNLQSIVAFQGTLITAAKEFFQGNGTPGDGSNNGIYFNIENIESEPNTQSYPTYKGVRKYVARNMNYQWPDFLENIPSEYSSCGVPKQDPKTCESEIPGLYTVFVALSAMSSMWNWGQSYLAGKDAASKAKTLDYLPSYKPEEVDEILSKAYGLLEANPADGIRSLEVYRSIQRAFYRGQDYMKNEDAMKEMLTELERIQKEDLPKMFCQDKSRNFNRDWKQAMEAESMLICSLATVHAALERKESRSPFFRTDYPKMDNKNYLCYLWTSMGKNGEWKVEKGDIVDSVLPREELLKILDDTEDKYDISIPNEYI